MQATTIDMDATSVNYMQASTTIEWTRDVAARRGRRTMATDDRVGKRANTKPSSAKSSSRFTCYKCGEHGHVARDCAARASGATTEGDDGGAKTERDDGDDNGDERTGKKEETKKRATSTTTKARAPKFTIAEHVLGPKGLIKVYEEFPAEYAKRAKGPGHELHDCEVLIAMYRAWALEMYPYAPADETLRRVDKFGSDRAVKAFTRELRERDFGGGVGDAVDALERGGRATAGDGDEGGDVFFPDEDDEGRVEPGSSRGDDAEEGDVDFPDDFEEEDYQFDDEDEDAVAAMKEAEREENSSDDDEGIALAGAKRGKKSKGTTTTTKTAFENLSKKVSKKAPVTEGEAPPSPVIAGGFGGYFGVDPSAADSPQRKVLRVRPKILDATDSDEDATPAEPVRRRRAVQMDDDDE